MTTETASPTAPHRPIGARRAWAMLVALTLLTVIGMTVVLPVLPFVVLRYVPDQGHLAIWVGILEGVNALCAFLVAPILGGLSDRIGRRPVIIASAFGAALGYLLFGLGGSIWMLLIGRIVQGITAGDMPALFAYLADITPPAQRARRFGLLGALSGIGMMAGPALGGLLAAISTDLPVFVTAAIALVIAILSIFALPESLAPERRTPRLDLRALHPLRVFRDAFARRELRGLLFGFVLVTVPFVFFVNNFSVLALDELSWTATQVGLLTAVVGILDIAIQGGLLAILLPRIGERGIIISGIVTQAVGLVALGVIGSLLAQPWLFVVGTLVLAAGQGATTATIDGVLSNSVGDDEQGWIAGAAQSLNSAIGMLAPVVAGLLYTVVAHSAPYWIGAVLMLAAVVVFVRARIASAAAGEGPGARGETAPEPAAASS
ncbi:MFS transporter [Homoserinibacter sp. YIM 151385]|uniref:MFS transporter n=1 Tax=Homoserinibacter sp. YIM 151385 TaxID=2985506 RepID=UPI0022F0BD5D|nr:MFS transporter [Homoserinibacter sp. YIM 151385]WBU37601.1 MFS transporter [Homoserinibacter sp. YIM 151385]